MVDSVDSVKRNTLFRYFNTSEKTKGDDDRKRKDAPKDSEGQGETGSESKKTQTEAAVESWSAMAPVLRKYKFYDLFILYTLQHWRVRRA